MSLPNSCHIFMFPFQWSVNAMNQERFGEQISFRNIITSKVIMNWDRIFEPTSKEDKITLFNEKNYFYEFVHDALYDNGKNDNSNIVRHYERNEPKHQDVFYRIKTVRKEYELKVNSITLNLYSTGVGVLIFSLNNYKYSEFNDILYINQFGRRVYPPYFAAKNPDNNSSELSKGITIDGLNGTYTEDFQQYNEKDTNKPADFLQKMVHEVAPNINIKAVIDDRMYCMSWFKNQKLVETFCKETNSVKNYANSEDWYRYVFVDGASCTCQNDEMRKKLLSEATYERWEKWGSLYGISRYSFVMLSSADEGLKHLYDTFESMYVRMAELILVQKSSVLRFSAEVTNISSMEHQKGASISERVRSLYKEYIRFVNQIHFREVSAQDQAIELYTMLYNSANLNKQVEKLDGEIEELYHYVSLVEDKRNSKMMSNLSLIATVFVPATFVAGVFGMNNNIANRDDSIAIVYNSFDFQIGLVGLAIIGFLIWYLYFKKKK